MTAVEHWGTFEVANFGDLLYPPILDHALRRALSHVEVTLTGPIGGRGPMGLDRPVRRAVRHDELGFWDQAAEVDAFVLGGGDLVHAGTGVVDLDGRIDRIDSWPFAVEMGLLAEVRPVAWNAVGVPFEVPAELAPLVQQACRQVQLLAVRDEGSRARLEAAGVEREISVTPDTAVLLDDVIPSAVRATALHDLRRAGRIPPSGPVVVVHVSFASPGVLAEVAGALQATLDAHPSLQAVLIALGPAHGDAVSLTELAHQLGRPSWLLADPTVTEVAAMLGEADLVVSSSYHASLVASTLGVPSIVFSHYGHRAAKTLELTRLLDRERWFLDRPSEIATAVDAVQHGEGRPDAARIAALQRAARTHLERVAEIAASPPPPGVDLAERRAAHRHLADRLESGRRTEARLRSELMLLSEHHRGAVQRARDREAAYWRISDRAVGATVGSILDLRVIESATLAEDPYRWAHVGPLFGAGDAARLAATLPSGGAEQRADSDGRRSWSYTVRALVPLGDTTGVRPHELDPAWRALADDLGGPRYRAALSRLTGVDLSELDLEANVFSYPAGGYQGPHPDLPEKVVTHVLWFNERWHPSYGGCLRILRSRDEADVAHELLPNLGWSAVFVRSAHSWHSVTAMADDAPVDRRAVVATFYRPGSPSTMWPHGP